MTAITSHLFLPELISEMPPGSAKDILYGQTDRPASLHLYILHFEFCIRVLWNTTVIYITSIRKPLLCSHRTTRTHLRDELYATGKLKEGLPGEPREDDLMLSTRVETISSIKFFSHLQLGDAVFHSQAYKGITRRNHHTDAYAQEGEISY